MLLFLKSRIALNTIKGIRGVKSITKVVSKDFAKEGIKVLDGKPKNENNLEDLSKNLAVEVISRSLER